MKSISFRWAFGSIALVCFSLIGYALYLQHMEGQLPCPLCIFQRYAFLAIGITALIGTVHGPQRTGAIVYATLLEIFAIAGVGVAAYHNWVIANPNTASCGRDLVEEFVNDLMPAKVLPQLFYAEGSCTAAFKPIFGLTVPVWSLLWLIALMIIAGVLFLSARRIRRAGDMFR